MDEQIELIYLRELMRQSRHAIHCSEQMNTLLQLGQIDNFFREAEHFLSHFGAISFLLWPAGNNRRARNRATHLRTILGIEDTNILNNRQLRNHIVHFDERLDIWAENSLGHNIVDQNIGNMQRFVRGLPETDSLRNYNPQTQEYSFLDELFNLQNILMDITDLAQHTQNRINLLLARQR